ncbi:MAG: precorrin-2 C(20)-methyltransferase [Desulfatiglans sp.]|jgi:precorrin-2/cobalt-factor-2 C20-methyltransferase|nr:precorrin-2 C(20)-methyltransferase [Thermodesulfobacteriota bacterium]MEE4353009.1 precorrin-2 C(20)-methyltransferase [Desulfatiglans sp.]
MQNGTLYGIGTGPGDPELLTLKAVKILSRVDVVFAASSTGNDHSLAVNIGAEYLKKDAPVLLLGFPMTRQKKQLVTAWEKNAQQVIEVLKKGRDAAFLTLGDPLTYSTFGYLMKTIEEIEPDINVEIVPGITSFQAGAAAAGHILAEAEESLTVVSGALGAKNLKRLIGHTDNVVILKVYRHYQEILKTLHDIGLNKDVTLISRCGLRDEKIVHDPQQWKDGTPPYLSTLLIKNNKKKAKEL